MSKYTTEVRYICETAAGKTESSGLSSVNAILTAAAPVVFNFDFPIFDEAYRLPLEIKILRHYYTREIGLETVGLWKLKLETKLTEIMPYYNQLYKSQLLEFNPLYDFDYTRATNRKGSGTSNSTASSKDDGTTSGLADGTSKVAGTNHSATNTHNKNTDRYSETPQGGLDSIEANTYLTTGRILDGSEDVTVDGTNGDDTTTHNSSSGTSHAESNTTGTGATTSLEDYTEHVMGKQGSASYSQMLKEFRETFLNIDTMVIEDLSDLFMMLW